MISKSTLIVCTALSPLFVTLIRYCPTDRIRIERRRNRAWARPPPGGGCRRGSVQQFSGRQSNPTTYLLKPWRCSVMCCARRPPGKLSTFCSIWAEREYQVNHALRQHTDVPVLPRANCCARTPEVNRNLRFTSWTIRRPRAQGPQPPVGPEWLEQSQPPAEF